MRELVNRDDLLDIIQNLILNNQSETLYVKTDGNRSVILTIANNKILGALSGVSRGAEALNYLAQAKQVSYHFAPEILNLPNSTPSADEVSRILGIQSKLISKTTPKFNQESLKSSIDSDTYLFEVIVKNLTEFVGPIAAILVNEIRQNSVGKIGSFNDLNYLLEILAEEIESLPESEQFILQTTADLDKLAS